MKKTVSLFLVLCLMLACLPAFAEDAAPAAQVFETADGVLSIEAPNAEWVELPDPNYWFAMSDGDDLITISHLSNGEALPATMVANEEFAAVCHAFVSTANEVFVIKGCAVSLENLKDIMLALSTVKILKFDTKQAVKPVAVSANGFVVDPISEVRYSTSKQLNVRASWSSDSARLGSLKKGEAVEVTGIVRRNGKNYGWYQINFNGVTAYASAKYLSANEPKNSGKSSGSFKVYSESGDTKTISLKNGKYVDNMGREYTDEGNGMFFCEMNGIRYARNRSVWTNGTADGGYYGEANPDDDPTESENVAAQDPSAYEDPPEYDTQDPDA